MSRFAKVAKLRDTRFGARCRKRGAGAGEPERIVTVSRFGGIDFFFLAGGCTGVDTLTTAYLPGDSAFQGLPKGDP